MNSVGVDEVPLRLKRAKLAALRVLGKSQGGQLWLSAGEEDERLPPEVAVVEAANSYRRRTGRLGLQRSYRAGYFDLSRSPCGIDAA